MNLILKYQKISVTFFSILFLSEGSMFIKYFITPLLVFTSLLTIAQTPIKVALIGNSTVTADKGWGGVGFLANSKTV